MTETCPVCRGWSSEDLHCPRCQPDPTIVIQTSHAWCLNCKNRLNVWAEQCVGYEGCGVKFKFVTTPYSGYKQKVKSMRDDLMWKDVAWAG